MASSARSVLATLAILAVLVSCRVRDRLTSAERARVVADVYALDDRWGAAAQRGDVEAALACFQDVGDFSFVYGGGIADHAAFREIVRKSYGARTGMSSELLGRRVTVADGQNAVVVGRSRVVVTPRDGARQSAEVVYGLTCRKIDGAWRAIHAYEFTLSQ